MQTILVTTVVLMLLAGFYTLVVSRNLIRLLIALEILTKAVTLFLVFAGWVTGDLATAQSFVITLIIIEAVIMVAAAGIVIGIFRHSGSLDIRNIRNLKG
jgi:NADH-quinone oxidoreductase subunit K